MISPFSLSIQERRRKLKKARTEEEEIAHRIATEERMLLVAQRKLESIRVLDDVLERVKVIVFPNFLRIQQQQPEQRFREIARSAPQGDNRFTFWQRCASYSCSVDAGVGTDPSIANPDSKAILIIVYSKLQT